MVDFLPDALLRGTTIGREDLLIVMAVAAAELGVVPPACLPLKPKLQPPNRHQKLPLPLRG
jgi:hypothetical protein